MIKRSTFLAKRDDLTTQQFREHWRGIHADIAAGFTGLAAYNQNHVLQRVDSGGPSTFFLDGIVELWFDGTAGGRPGRDPDVSAALVADEPRFLRGLTGGEVLPADVYPTSTYKFWIVGRWRSGDAAPDELRRAASALGELVRSPAPVQSQYSAVGETFTREALDVDPAPPQAAIIVPMGPRHPLPLDRLRIEQFIGSGQLPLDSVACVLAQEERIPIP